MSTKKFLLEEKDIPTAWYNSGYEEQTAADLKSTN